MHTAPQRRLLKEFASRFAPPRQNPYISVRQNLDSEQSKNTDSSQSKRSGNLETPVKPKHKGLMGQPDNPHGTHADKPGKPPAAHTRPEGSSKEPGGLADTINVFRSDPSGLKTEGEPLQRGISPTNSGKSETDLHPSGTAPQARLQGPAENPGRQTWTGFGNRYSGIKTGNFK